MLINMPSCDGTTVQPLVDVVNCHPKCSPFSLIVPFSHSEQPPKALKRPFQPNLALQVAHLAPGNLNLITIPYFDKVC